MALLDLHVDVTGKRSIAEDLARFEKRARDLAKRILAEKTQKMAELAKTLAPFEEGELRGRIHATRVAANGEFGVQAHVRAARSVIQHEDLTLHHPLGGGPKFIERAVLAIAPEITQDLEEGLPGLLK